MATSATSTTPAKPLPRPLPETPGGIYYPETDGRPMAETDIHARCIIDVRFMLDMHFAADPDVYVSGNLMMYFTEGVPAHSISPDVFVVRGVPKGLRRVYKLWEEQVAPQFVLEVTSRSTRPEDLGGKRGHYEYMGVSEYVLFDPLEEYLVPPFQAFRLLNGRYEPVAPTASGAIVSEVLGLELHRRGDQLRLFDPRRSEWLRTPAEAEAARQSAEAARDAEVEARRQAEMERAIAERELARLRAELDRRQ